MMSAIFTLLLSLRNRFSITIPFSFTGYRKPMLKHFKPEEVEGLNNELCVKLDQAREIANSPFRITSGKRTVLENEQTLNSVSDSSHLTGLAVDLSCTGSEERYAMVKALLAVGFNRIGVYSAHIHVDCDTSKPQNVIWYVAGA